MTLTNAIEAARGVRGWIKSAMQMDTVEAMREVLMSALKALAALPDKPMTEEEICQLIFEGSGRQFFPDEVQDVFQKLKAAGVLFVKED